MVFWKDSLDFNRIIKKQQDQVDTRGGAGGSPDRRRATSYKKAADDAIAQIKARGTLQEKQLLGSSVILSDAGVGRQTNPPYRGGPANGSRADNRGNAS